MVADDDLQAELLRVSDLVDRGDSAIDGQDQAAALVREARQRLPANAVPLVEPARQMRYDVGPELAQDQDREGGRADPVGVVIPVDADATAGGDGAADRLTRRGHVAEPERVMRWKLACQERPRTGGVVVTSTDENRGRRAADLEIPHEGRRGLPVARFDRPAAVVHGQT